MRKMSGAAHTDVKVSASVSNKSFAAAAGVSLVALGTGLIAGAVGGPIFWLWLGVLLQRDAVKAEPAK
jgi:hypothetical protein